MATRGNSIESTSYKYTHIIAIDFGTSGCGIAVWNVAAPSIENIHVFSNWFQQSIGVTYKCPTILLLDHEENVETFGPEAIQKYYSKRVAHRNKINDYYLFTRFKTDLYNQNLTRNVMVNAANGKALPLLKVIAKCLRYMRIAVISDLDKQIPHPNRKIRWILTVPAIWSPAAKQMMREAAQQAGLGIDFSLQLVLEPEAAAMWCQKEILNIETSQDPPPQNITHCYLVVDCGGGTIDMAAHKLTKTSDGKINIDEIHRAHGGLYGGFGVNDEFEDLLKDIFQFSNEEIKKLKSNYSRQWFRFIHEDFEYAKRFTTSDEITLIMPQIITKYVQETTSKSMEQLVSEYKRHKIQWFKDEGEVVLPLSTLKALYSPVIHHITNAIGEVLKKPECKVIEQILLVGGFAESDFLFHEVEKTFSGLNVKKSAVPSISVLKGAIIYGLHQDMITSRTMCQSIGINTWDNFMPGIHDDNRKIVVDGRELCKNVFTMLVEVNKSVRVDTKIEHSFAPASKDRDTCKVEIFGSHDSKAFYTDECSCYKIGVLTIEDLPKFGNNVSREVLILLNVSGTEITASASCNGRTQELSVDLDFIGD